MFQPLYLTGSIILSNMRSRLIAFSVLEMILSSCGKDTDPNYMQEVYTVINPLLSN